MSVYDGGLIRMLLSMEQQVPTPLSRSKTRALCLSIVRLRHGVTINGEAMDAIKVALEVFGVHDVEQATVILRWLLNDPTVHHFTRDVVDRWIENALRDPLTFLFQQPQRPDDEENNPPVPTAVPAPTLPTSTRARTTAPSTNPDRSR